MLCNLPYTLVYKKIKTLRQATIDRLNAVPVSFRAGRWGFGPVVARAIDELGYKIDTSVTPFINWDKEYGPDFSNAPASCYWFEHENVLLENEAGRLLEVPPSIGFLQKEIKRAGRVRNWLLNSPFSKIGLLGILDRLKILSFRWLSPELSDGPQMVSLSKNLIGRGYSFLNMSFHSTSLLPGASPFVQNERQFRRFMEDIKIFLSFALENGMEFLPLGKALEHEKGRST